MLGRDTLYVDQLMLEKSLIPNPNPMKEETHA